MRGFGDLVTMPLPAEWGPTVIPAGAVTSLPAGSQIGWQQVSGGWILAVRNANGNVTAVPGASVVPFPGAQSPSDSDYPTGDYPNGVYPSGIPNTLSAPGQLIVPNPTTGRPLPPGSTDPGATWGRAPILPDSMLPPSLQRGNPLLRFATFQKNAYDRVLAKRTALWGYIRAHGGLKSCCRIPELGAPIWDQPPWQVQPSQGEPFQEMFSQPIANFEAMGGGFSGVDVILGQFVVPNGYDGALNRFVCQFTGNGFADFSGSIAWRVMVGQRFARNLGNVLNTYGSYQTAFMVPGTDNMRLVSGQTITLLANVPVGSPVSDGMVTAGVFGWFYPRR